MKKVVISALIGLCMLPHQADGSSNSISTDKLLLRVGAGCAGLASVGAGYWLYQRGKASAIKEFERLQALEQAAAAKARLIAVKDSFIQNTLLPILNVNPMVGEWFHLYKIYVDATFTPWFNQAQQYVNTMRRHFTTSMPTDFITDVDSSRQLNFNPYLIAQLQYSGGGSTQYQRNVELRSGQLAESLANLSGEFTFDINTVKTIKLLQSGATLANASYAASSAQVQQQDNNAQQDPILVVNISKYNQTTQNLEQVHNGIIIVFSRSEQRYYAYVYDENQDGEVVLPDALQSSVPVLPAAAPTCTTSARKWWWPFSRETTSVQPPQQILVQDEAIVEPIAAQQAAEPLPMNQLPQGPTEQTHPDDTAAFDQTNEYQPLPVTPMPMAYGTPQQQLTDPAQDLRTDERRLSPETERARQALLRGKRPQTASSSTQY